MLRLLRRLLLVLLLGALMVLGSHGPAHAENWSVLSRYWHPTNPYGSTGEPGCPDCAMPWQPIRSVMHPNVLPPGMRRPWPLRRPQVTLAPATPWFVPNGPGHVVRAHWHDLRHLLGP
ncbi:MAG: hypothetical protein KatS3mg110_4608 [Pirellulaceae bacterium]|nr:MAG: hypothetical protein KatS3mg110_4608 [Pirellulaceae bacterium]